MGGQGEVETRYHDIIVLRPVIQFIDICNIIFIYKELKSLRDLSRKSSTLYTTLLFFHVAVRGCYRTTAFIASRSRTFY